MGKFEIINPSDEAYIEGEFKEVCVATALFSNGQYSLKQVDGVLEMPLFLFGAGMEWWEKTFGKPFKELLDNVDWVEVANALESVHLAGKRSSCTDVVGYAKDQAQFIRKNIIGKKNKKLTSDTK